MADIQITTAIQGLQQVRKGLEDLERGLRGVGSSAGTSNSNLKGTAENINSVGTSAARTNNTLGGLVTSFRSLNGVLATLGLAQASARFLDVLVSMDQMRASLGAATGDLALAGSAFNDVQKTANRLGLNIGAVATSFSQFTASARGTTLEGIQGTRVFEAFTGAAAKLGASADDTKGIIRALGQIISKGSVQAEELRGQLGDRLPGAVQIMARALGVTTAELDKMLRAGTVAAETALPAMARELENAFGIDSTTRINTLQASINRVFNAVTNIVDAIGQAGFAERLRVAFEGIAAAGEVAGNAIRFLSGEISGAQFVQRASDADVLGRSISFIGGVLEGLPGAGTVKFFRELAQGLRENSNEANNFATALKVAQANADMFAEAGAAAIAANRQAIIDGIEATDRQRKAEADRLEAFVKGQQSSIDVLKNKARQERDAQESARREAEQTAREAERAAKEAASRFKERQQLILDTARFERDQGKKTTDDIIGLLRERLAAVASNTREELQLKQMLAEEEKRFAQERMAAEADRLDAFIKGQAESTKAVRDAFDQQVESVDSFNKILSDIPAIFTKTFDPVKDFRSLVEGAFSNLKNSISSFIQTGKFKFSDFFGSLRGLFANFLASRAVARFQNLFSGTPGGGGFLSGLASIFKGTGGQGGPGGLNFGGFLGRKGFGGQTFGEIGLTGLGGALFGASLGQFTGGPGLGSTLGGGLGGGLAAIVGETLLPGIGGFIGSALGGALGGLIGGIFGGGKKKTKIGLAGEGEIGNFGIEGPFGLVGLSAASKRFDPNTFKPFLDAVVGFDKAIASVAPDKIGEITAALKGFSSATITSSDDFRPEQLEGLVRERLDVVFTAISDEFAGLAELDAPIEQIVQDFTTFQGAMNTLRGTFDQTSTEIDPFDQALVELQSVFAQGEAAAMRLGLSTVELRSNFEQAVTALEKQRVIAEGLRELAVVFEMSGGAAAKLAQNYVQLTTATLSQSQIQEQLVAGILRTVPAMQGMGFSLDSLSLFSFPSMKAATLDMALAAGASAGQMKELELALNALGGTLFDEELLNLINIFEQATKETKSIAQIQEELFTGLVEAIPGAKEAFDALGIDLATFANMSAAEFKDLIPGILQFSGAAGATGDELALLQNALKALGGTLVSVANSAGRANSSLSSSLNSSSSVAAFQTGGVRVATRPTLALVGETGPERLTVEPLGGQRSRSSGGSVVFNGPVIAGGDSSMIQLARQIARIIQGETARVGAI